MANGWTTQNGKLPGLFGNTVDIPYHLVSISDYADVQTLSAYVQNGTLYISGLISGEKWSIYDISGKLICENVATDVTQSIPIQISNGIYILRAGTRIIKLIAN
jgi:hypothetical protein